MTEHWIELLDQDQHWMDREGTVLQLDEMSPEYCGRVHAFLMRQSEGILLHLTTRLILGTQPNGDMASLALDSEIQQLVEHTGQADEWLVGKTLLTALKRRAQGLPAAEAVTDEDGRTTCPECAHLLSDHRNHVGCGARPGSCYLCGTICDCGQEILPKANHRMCYPGMWTS